MRPTNARTILFIPFLAIPQFDWIFKNWIRAFIQFSMIQVVAFAALFVFQRFVFVLPATNRQT